MLPIEAIRWTSRAEVCDLLVTYLHSFASSSEGAAGDARADTIDLRERAALLLIALADDPHASLLIHLLLNPDENPEVRRTALYRLTRDPKNRQMVPPVNRGAVVSSEECRQLMRDPALWDSADRSGTLASLLALCPSEDAGLLTQSILAGLTTEERADLLFGFAYEKAEGGLDPDAHPVIQTLFERLYHLWMVEGAALLEEAGGGLAERSLEIAFWTREREPSRKLLCQYWRWLSGAASEHAEKSVGISRESLIDLVNGRCPSISLDLPGGWQNELLHLLRYRVEMRSICLACEEMTGDRLAATCPVSLTEFLRHFAHDPTILLIEEELRAAGLTLYDRAVTDLTDPSVAARRLQEWPDVGTVDRICTLVADPDAEHHLGIFLLEVLAREHRDIAAALVLRMAQNLENPGLTEQMVKYLLQEPQATERDLMLWGASQDQKPLLLYRCLRGLEALREDGPEWRERLQHLTEHGHPLVRLNALAGLVRRGEATLVGEIIQATAAVGISVRSEAIRLLGELDGGRNLDLLRRALLTDQKFCPDSLTPVAEEAVYALARLGTPQALTIMIQAYLTMENSMAWGALDDYLSALARGPNERVCASIRSLIEVCRGCSSEECLRYPGH